MASLMCVSRAFCPSTAIGQATTSAMCAVGIKIDKSAARMRRREYINQPAPVAAHKDTGISHMAVIQARISNGAALGPGGPDANATAPNRPMTKIAGNEPRNSNALYMVPRIRVVRADILENITLTFELWMHSVV